MRLLAAAIVLLTVVAAQSTSTNPGPGSPGSTALPVVVERYLHETNFSTPNAATVWGKSNGTLTAAWTPLTPDSFAGLDWRFGLWLAHTNAKMFGRAQKHAINNYLAINKTLNSVLQNTSYTFSADLVDDLVPGPGFVLALIIHGNTSGIFAVSEQFEIKGAGGRRVALPSTTGILLGAAGVLASAVLLV